MKASINRRTFLKLASIIGLSFSSIAVFAGNLSKNQIPQQPDRIDVHHHILPPVYTSALAKIGIKSAGGVPFPYWNAQQSLHVMDRNGIATAITSVSSPGIYFGDINFSQDLARRCNEFSANLVNEHQERFGAFAVLPLPDVNAALREVEYALDNLKLDGIVLLTNVGGRYLGDPEFDELFYELNRRKAIVYIHPTDPPGENLPKLKLPSSIVEFVFDTTRAIANLIYSGTMERCPNIRFIVSHAGGTAPYLAWRISLYQYKAGMQEKVPQGVITYLKRFYYDTALSAAPYALRSLQELVDPSHILFGSDYPFARELLTSVTIRSLKNYGGFDDRALKAVEQENALRLFPRLSKG
jgi:predicted TIM-barrel fold metal-dependent hydrolase